MNIEICKLVKMSQNQLFHECWSLNVLIKTHWASFTNGHTTENWTHGRFYAKLGVYQCGHEWWLRSNLTSGLSSSTHILSKPDLTCSRVNLSKSKINPVYFDSWSQYCFVYVQVHLNKLECVWKSSFISVIQLKLWNSCINIQCTQTEIV